MASASKKFIYSGVALMFFGVVLVGATYLPLAWAHLRYIILPKVTQAKVVAVSLVDPQSNGEYVVARSAEFGIIIPKIHANVPVVGQVNPFDAEVYQNALSKGVAHAAGTALPDQPGQMFLFAHSAGDITRARQYNAVFYLLDKLQPLDDIYIYYQNKPYRYQVEKLEVVAPEQVEFLKDTSTDRKLILMTCTPAGTTRQRLLVHAKLIPVTP